MKKGLLSVTLLMGLFAIGQQANRTASTCSFTPAFTINDATQCLSGNSFAFTNTTSEAGTYSLGNGTTPADLSYSGFSMTANSGQSFIIRLYIYGGATAARSVRIRNFQLQGSTSAGTVTSLWALTANNTFAISGAGSASVTGQNESLTGLNNGGFTANGHQLGHTGAWPSTLTTTEYQQFQITPNGAYNLTLTSLAFRAVSSGGSGTPIITVKYSTDGGTTFNPFPFVGNVSASGLTYDWNFGDATAHSASTSPSHSYTSPGSYTVTLTAMGGSCTSTSTQTVDVTGPVVYVNLNASGNNNGTSWANAFTTLQPAIDAAASCGAQVWVAQGTYKPNSYPWASAGASNRDYAFALKNNAAVYGGFVGTETLLSQRNYATNITTLSGDIGTVGDNTDNCHHVVLCSNLNSTAILDGFTITKGYADVNSNLSVNGDNYSRRDGGAMINRASTQTINNCIFTNNYCADEGGAMYNLGASPTISNCSFTANNAKYGGAINNSSSSNASITNSSFTSNTSLNVGGAIRNDASSPTISGCTFSSNTSPDGGAISFEASSSVSITNCTFTSNSGDRGAGIYIESSPTGTISNSVFTSNISTNRGGGLYIESSSISSVSSCTFIANSASRGGGMYIESSSPAITSCIFSGNIAPISDKDGAGMYITGSSCSPVISKCIFSGNIADDTGGGGYQSK